MTCAEDLPQMERLLADEPEREQEVERPEDELERLRAAGGV